MLELVLNNNPERKFHVHDLCRDFQRLSIEPGDVAFEYVGEGSRTLVVMVRDQQVTQKTALKLLSETLMRLADEAAALASAIPADAPVVIDESNKAVTDAQ